MGANYAKVPAKKVVEGFYKMLNEKWGYIWGEYGRVWTAANQAALEKKYNSNPSKYSDYEYGAKYGKKWIDKHVTDCSGAFKRVLQDNGSDIFHGSNTMWNVWNSAKGELKNGKRTDGQELKPGTAVYTYNKNTGRRGHVGCYVGGGVVIEAEGTIKGVIESKITNKKWVEWGELKVVDYSGVSDIDPVKIVTPVEKPADEGAQITLTYPTLRQGAKGDLVTQLQDLLAKAGSNLQVDGIFGNGTRSAVQAFQRKYGLEVDGVVGPKTWKKLLEVAGNIKTETQEKPKTYSITIKGLAAAEADALNKKYPNSVITFE